jgi:hypothetical protein
MDRREQLVGWIEETRRLQRTLGRVFATLAVVVLGIWMWRGDVAAAAFVFLAVVAIIAFWVTAAHNDAHRHKLAELDRIEKTRGDPAPRAAHRRW